MADEPSMPEAMVAIIGGVLSGDIIPANKRSAADDALQGLFSDVTIMGAVKAVICD